MRRPYLLVLAVVVAAACGRDKPRPPFSTVKDEPATPVVRPDIQLDSCSSTPTEIVCVDGGPRTQSSASRHDIQPTGGFR